MKLIRLGLQNFMGIRALSVQADGKNLSVYGGNGTGKTTLFNAFLWVLFDKDSQGKKDFQLKTLDAAGKEIPMIEHSVELVLEYNNTTITLKKTLTEVWTKKRGSATAAFTGHETAYEVDGVPKAKKEFDFYISSLGDETLLRMLTDPDFFAGKMAWKDRRNILLGMSPDLTDEAVIASDASLKDLTALLAGKSIEDFRKVVAARKAKVNAEIQMIPIRVDEATRALPEIGTASAEVLQTDLAGARANLAAIETKLLELSQGGAATDKKLLARTIEAQIIAATNKAAELKQAGTRVLTVQLNQLSVQHDAVVRNRSNTATVINDLNGKITTTESALDAKRGEWKSITAEQLPAAEENCNCPTCGQHLPENQLQAARDKREADFRQAKSVRLTANEAAGKQLKSDLNTAKEKLTETEATLPKLDAEIEKLAAEIAILNDKINARNNEADAEPIELTALRSQLAEVNLDIEQATNDTTPEKEKLTAAKSQWQTESTFTEQQLAKIAQAEQGQARIKELKAQEKVLTAEYEQLNRSDFLSEEFIRAKVGLLESTINGKFKFARFKLFETQINGGLNEVCEVLGPDMVPYSSGLNNAAKINTGIDIINALSEHFGFTAPCFIDNAEAVTHIIASHAQQIHLIVSGSDQTLRVEAA